MWGLCLCFIFISRQISLDKLVVHQLLLIDCIRWTLFLSGVVKVYNPIIHSCQDTSGGKYPGLYIPLHTFAREISIHQHAAV